LFKPQTVLRLIRYQSKSLSYESRHSIFAFHLSYFRLIAFKIQKCENTHTKKKKKKKHTKKKNSHFTNSYIFALLHFRFFALLHFRFFAVLHFLIVTFSRSGCTCAWRHQFIIIIIIFFFFFLELSVHNDTLFNSPI
jgi:hypothetical protein